MENTSFTRSLCHSPLCAAYWWQSDVKGRERKGALSHTMHLDEAKRRMSAICAQPRFERLRTRRPFGIRSMLSHIACSCGNGLHVHPEIWGPGLDATIDADAAGFPGPLSPKPQGRRETEG